MKRGIRSTMRLALAALMAMTLVVVVQAPAQAFPANYTYEIGFPTFHGDGYNESYSRSTFIYHGSNLAGFGRFSADPVGDWPGDAIQACDYYADGWGIEIRMDINPAPDRFYTDRTATTRGHNSPYCSPWATGNIAENTLVALKVCLVKGTTEHCTPMYYART